MRFAPSSPHCLGGGIRFSSAALIAVTPVLIVGSGAGAHNGECNEGNGLPARRL